MFRSCPQLKVAHVYKNFLEQNSKFPSYQPMEQFGVPCVKRGEGFCYFDCNIFCFGQIKLYSIVGRPFAVVLFPMVPIFTTKNYFVTADIFIGGWVGWTENVILTFCVTKCVWTSPLKEKNQNSMVAIKKRWQQVHCKYFIFNVISLNVFRFRRFCNRI